MLNKELLLASKADTNSILLTVGKTSSGSYYGYLENMYGGINRVPYWNTATDGIYYKLLAFSYETGSGISNVVLTPSETTKEDPMELLYVTINSKTHAFYPRRGWDYGVYDDIFGFVSNLGRTLVVTFDPPQTGTSIRKHSNRSRVLRRRRSSLGGSKC